MAISEQIFYKNGINYHIIRKGIPITGRHWPRFFRFDLWTNNYFLENKNETNCKKCKTRYNTLARCRKRVLYSKFQFTYNKLPVFITIQGFISKSNADSTIVKMRKRQIDSNFNTLLFQMSLKQWKILQSINSNVILHWLKI